MAQKLDQINVKSKNSADVKELTEHLHTNMNMINTWLEPCWEHKKKALIVSAGRSLDGYLTKIKKKQKEGYVIYCIKHALPKLIKAGINPEAVIMLDPRPIEGYSTHGETRKDLYENVPKDTLFLVASMTHPSVTQHLFERGLNVVGWHAAVTGLIEVLRERKMDAVMIFEGTSSATRGVGLLKMLGFRHIELVAFDSDVEEPTEAQKRERNVEGPNKYTQILDDEGNVHWTTGELMAQIQDIRSMVKTHMTQGNLKLSMWEGGLGYMAFMKEKKIQDEILKGGGFNGAQRMNQYDDLFKRLRKPMQFQMLIRNSEGKAVEVMDQGLINSFATNIGLDWNAIPVVQ